MGVTFFDLSLLLNRDNGYIQFQVTTVMVIRFILPGTGEFSYKHSKLNVAAFIKKNCFVSFNIENVTLKLK